MSFQGTPAPQVEQKQDDQPDRKDILREQFDEVEQQQAAEAQKEPVVDAQGRVRGPDGKFAAKTAAAPVAQVEQPAAQVDQPVERQPWQTAPKSWKKEIAQDWEKLDPRYQQYVHEREQQMHAGIEPLLPKAQFADQVMQMAQPYMQTIQGLGIDLPRAIQGLMEVDHQLRTLPYQQKLQVLAETARAYGIDLTGQVQQAQPTYDPYIQQQQNELLQLRGQFNAFIQQQETLQQQAALDEIQRFSKTAEHFDEVKPLMAQLLQSGLAVGIEDAYERAVRLTPEIFDAVQSAKQAQTEAEKRATADAAAKKARAAAVSVKTATPGTKTAASAQDRRSILREQIEGLSERL